MKIHFLRQFVSIAALLIFSTKTPAEAIQLNEDSYPKANGIWLNSDYGWLLQVNSSGLERWQITPNFCYPSKQEGQTAMSSIEYRYFEVLDDKTAKFEYFPGDGHTLFTKLDSMPEKCGQVVGSSLQDTFEVFVDIFANHYAFFEQREVNWDELTDSKRNVLAKITTKQELFELLSSMIEPLGDSHTKLIATINGDKNRYQAGFKQTLPTIQSGIGEQAWLIGLIKQLQEDILDEGSVHTANERMVIGSIDNRIGYIQIFTMGGFSEDFEFGSVEWAKEEMRLLDYYLSEAIKSFKGYEAVIIDLSNNRGGFDQVARGIAAHFTHEPFEAYSVRTDWNSPPTITYTIKPAITARFTGPIYLMTSDVTVSGGEIATMTLRNLPNVTHVGQTTRGSFSTPLAKPLPNGWYLELSNEIFASPEGTVYEGQGIQPEIPIQVFELDNPIQSHALALQEVVNLIDSAKSKIK